MKSTHYYICALCLIGVQGAFAFGPFTSTPYLTPTASPTSSIYINWNTAGDESTIVAYGMTPTLEDTVRVPGIRTYHHVMLTDLLPSTQYYYEVIPSGALKTFTAFPLASDTFSFVAFGDTRSDSVAHQSVIDGIAAHDFSFILHTGDLVHDGNNTSEWNTFFNIEDTVLQDHHFLPSIGNHESPYWPYDTLFALPEPEDYYSVTFGNAHVVGLNTSIDLYGAQRDWLTNDLMTVSADTTIDWIFVFFHRPPYSSGNHGSQLDVRDAWCQLFEDYGVDMVFSGHDHCYERTVPINGVVYIVTGGGGAPLRDVDSSSWTAYSEKTYHFCLIAVTAQKLVFKAIKPDGTVFDTTVIDKTIGIEEHMSLKSVLHATPNPFIDDVTITYTLLTTGHVSLKICDSVGRSVVTLVDKDGAPGTYTLLWNGDDNFHRDIDAGPYFVILDHDNHSVIRKLVKIAR